MKFTTSRSTRQSLLPDGVYDAIFSDIEERENATGNFLLWRFVVTHDGEDYRLTKPSSGNFGPKSNARKIVEAVLGRRLDDGEAVETEELEGKGCTLVVGTVEKDGSVFNSVEAVTPRRVSGKRPRA